MKKSKLILTGILVLLFICLFFTGCPDPLDPPYEKETLNNPVVEENSFLFIEDDDTGIICFETNNTKYTGGYGYTLWKKEDAVQAPFTNLNVSLKKIRGNDVAGYGVVFGSHDNTMLIVLIDTKKSFIIGELTGNLFTELQPRTNSSNLIPGFNQENIIDISYNSVTKDYLLSFNGLASAVFRDDEEPFHTSGKNGYMVVISPLDDFPNTSVSVTFKKN